MNIQPDLKGELVRIRPLRREDFENLYDVARDPKIWEQHQNSDRYTLKNFTIFFDEAISSKGALAIIDVKTGKIIGSSRFKISELANGIVEIGWSFLSKEYWGGQYNREFKKLLVNHALTHFEAVIFYVNNKNLRSQKAMLKLGALQRADVDTAWVLPLEKGMTFSIASPLK